MFELEIIRYIQSWFVGPLGWVFVVLLSRWMIFAFIPLTLAIPGMMAFERRFQRGLSEVAWSLFASLSLSLVIGRLIGRTRPFHAWTSIALFIPPPSAAGSFPSSHAATAFAMATALAFADKRLAIIGFIVAVLVAFGRIAAGVHYPSDVIAGAALGIASAFIVRWLHVLWRRAQTKPMSGV